MVLGGAGTWGLPDESGDATTYTPTMDDASAETVLRALRRTRQVRRFTDEPVDEAAIRAKLQKAVDRVNAELSVIEKVRRFTLADEPFSVDNEQMTPSMKIRRHVLKGVYADRLDALYGK